MLKNIFFDLDGTLITMDQDEFIKMYFSLVEDKAVKAGFNKENLSKALYQSIMGMYINDGIRTCEQIFWDKFKSFFDKKDHQKLVDLFIDFYDNEFDELASICPPIKEAVELIKWCKNKGYNLVLATNPLFPRIATLKRIKWGQLSQDDFIEITTYEDNYYLKPDTKYFLSLLDKLGYKAEETIMVGNNVIEDMPASKVGMYTFLLTDQLMNEKGEDISKYHHGSFKELKEYLESLSN